MPTARASWAIVRGHAIRFQFAGGPARPARASPFRGGSYDACHPCGEEVKATRSRVRSMNDKDAEQSKRAVASVPVGRYRTRPRSGAERSLRVFQTTSLTTRLRTIVQGS